VWQRLPILITQMYQEVPVHCGHWKRGHRHRRLAEYDGILARIRNLPGFSEFLRPKKSESLHNAATRHFAPPDSAIDTESSNVLQRLWHRMVQLILRYLKVDCFNLCHHPQIADTVACG